MFQILIILCKLKSSGTSITLSIVSDELQGPLGETNLNTLKSYANRDVFVYKAFIDPDDGTLIDSSAVLIFKGIITQQKLLIILQVVYGQNGDSQVIGEIFHK